MLFHSCWYCLGRTVWQPFISLDIVQNQLDCSTNNKYSNYKLAWTWIGVILLPDFFVTIAVKFQLATNLEKIRFSTCQIPLFQIVCNIYAQCSLHRLPCLGNVAQCWVHIMSIIVLKRNLMNKSSTSALWSRNKHGCKGWELLFQKNVIGHRF